MVRVSRTEAIQRDLPEVIRQWLTKEELINPGEEVTVRVTITSPPSPQVSVFASVENVATGKNRGTRANPRARTDPKLTDDDWEKILTYSWEFDYDRTVLRIIRERNNAKLTIAEAAALSNRSDDWQRAICDSRINCQLKKLGLGELRLLSDGPHGKNTGYRIYRMI